MTKAAILIDGGYFLRRLPTVRPDIDETDVDAVVRSVGQLIQGHLQQLKEVHTVPNHFQLLYRTFYYDARPYEQKAQTPVGRQPINYAQSRQARFRNSLFSALHGFPNLAVRLGEVR